MRALVAETGGGVNRVPQYLKCMLRPPQYFSKRSAKYKKGTQEIEERDCPFYAVTQKVMFYV